MVDDHLMRITHVTRGEEWISSTPKHVLLYQWLGIPLPTVRPLPAAAQREPQQGLQAQEPVVDARLVPRAGIPARGAAQLPGADGLVDAGRPRGLHARRVHRRTSTSTRISPTGPIFDLNKLDWLNGHYIRQLSLTELAERVRPFLERAGIVPNDPPLEAVLPLIHERLKRLGEAPELLGFFYADQPTYDDALLVPKGLDRPTAASLLAEATTIVSGAPAFDHATLEASLRELAAESRRQDRAVVHVAAGRQHVQQRLAAALRDDGGARPRARAVERPGVAGATAPPRRAERRPLSVTFRPLSMRWTIGVYCLGQCRMG